MSDPLEWIGGVWTAKCTHQDDDEPLCTWAKEHPNRAWLRARLAAHLKTHQKKDETS